MPKGPRRKTSYTGAIEDPIVRFAAELARAVQYHRLYPPEHPYVKTAAGSAHAACEVAFNKRSPFTLGASEAGFFVEGEMVQDVPGVVADLAKMFGRINIHSMTFARGVTEPQIRDFVVGLGRLENAAVQGTIEQAAIEELTRNTPHIEINTYSYQKVLTGEGELLDKVKDVAAQTGRDGIELLDVLLEDGAEALSGASGRRLSDAAASRPGEVASLLDKVLPQVLTALGQDEDNLSDSGGLLNIEAGEGSPQIVRDLHKKVVALFDRIGAAMAMHKKVGISEASSALETIVSMMPPSKQKLLLGREVGQDEEVDLRGLLSALPQHTRVELLFNEMLAGKSEPEKLRGELKSVLRRGAELAEIVNKVSQKAKELGSQESVETIISRMAATLQSGISVRELARGTVVVIEPDARVSAEYRAGLVRAGFLVSAFTDGTEALEQIRHNPPDLLITEIKLPGMSAIEILHELRKEPRPVPVIVATQYRSFAGDFEIVTYPKHAFFNKPVSLDVLMEKVKEFVPEKAPAQLPGPAGTVLMDSEELEIAQEVQQSLLPEALPRVEGFDIAAYYSPCKEVGGDYYDVLAQDDGGWMFVVADVSGKGVPAAMVMVLVRSLVHLSVSTQCGPREAVLELNRLLSKEIKPGLFVSALCVRLDAAARTATICSAGHMPAVLWVPGRHKPRVSLLEHTGVVLGLGDTDYFRERTKEQELHLLPGSGVMIYTDGVTETMNTRRQEFGTERLMRLASHSTGMSSHEINKAVRTALGAFSSGVPQHDDTTILTIKCTG